MAAQVVLSLISVALIPVLMDQSLDQAYSDLQTR